MRNVWTTVVVAVALLVVGVAAQEKEYQPTCNMCPGTYVPNAEIQALREAGDRQQADRSAGAAGRYRQGSTWAWRRVPRQDRRSVGDSVAEHDLVSEVYHIIDGSATLVLGPDLVDKQRRPAPRPRSDC